MGTGVSGIGGDIKNVVVGISCQLKRKTQYSRDAIVDERENDWSLARNSKIPPQDIYPVLLENRRFKRDGVFHITSYRVSDTVKCGKLQTHLPKRFSASVGEAFPEWFAV